MSGAIAARRPQQSRQSRRQDRTHLRLLMRVLTLGIVMHGSSEKERGAAGAACCAPTRAGLSPRLYFRSQGWTLEAARASKSVEALKSCYFLSASIRAMAIFSAR